MEDNVIYFTKLETVKSKGFNELTYVDFFKKLSLGIQGDVLRNQVLFDEEKQEYTIIYNGETYKVYYVANPLTPDCEREEIINNLGRLCNLTRQRYRVVEIEQEEKEKEKREYEEIIENGEQGIYYSDEDKKTYVEYLKKTTKNSVFSGVFLKLLEKLDPNDVTVTTIAFSLVEGFMGLLLLFSVFPIYVPLSIIADCVLGVVMMNRSLDDNGVAKKYGMNVATSLLYLVVNAFAAPVYLMKNIIKKHRAKKRVRELIKSINKTKISEKPIEKVIEETKAPEVIKVEEVKVQDGIAQDIVRGFSKLNDGIEELSDENIEKLRLSQEILDLLQKYQQHKDIDNPEVGRNIYNQVGSLLYRLGRELKKQRAGERSKKDFRTLLAANDSILIGSTSESKEDFSVSQSRNSHR